MFGSNTADSYYLKGAIEVRGGSHRAVVFLEMKGWNGSQFGAIKLGERFIMAEEMVR